MSAYQVHSDTIDLLVAAADRWRLQFITEDGQRLHVCSHRTEAGQLLTDENARSVSARYNTTDPVERYTYTFLDLDRAAAGLPIPVLVLGSVRCLRYQSCETEAYPTSPAAQLLDAIEAEACRQLINVHDAPWGFTRSWMDDKRATVKAAVAAQTRAALLARNDELTTRCRPSDWQKGFNNRHED
jgi:hypothetical protein